MPFLKYWIFSFTAYFAFAYIVLDRPPHTLPKKNGEIFAFSNVLLTPWCPAVLASCRYQITTSLIDLGIHIFHFTFPTSISQSKHKTLFLISQHLATYDLKSLLSLLISSHAGFSRLSNFNLKIFPSISSSSCCCRTNSRSFNSVDCLFFSLACFDRFGFPPFE